MMRGWDETLAFLGLKDSDVFPSGLCPPEENEMEENVHRMLQDVLETKSECDLCLRGTPHHTCLGEPPARHPCLRVWGRCKYDDKCVFASYPRVWCLYCLRRANHNHCDGICPENLPHMPANVSASVQDHAEQLRRRALEQRQFQREQMRLGGVKSNNVMGSSEIGGGLGLGLGLGFGLGLGVGPKHVGGREAWSNANRGWNCGTPEEAWRNRTK